MPHHEHKPGAAVDAIAHVRHPPRMSTLAEIEQAADTLPPEQKQELILFLAARLRADGAQMPASRRFSKEEMAGWIAEDEADMERFRRGA
jgi:hypothetical protein